MDPDAPPQPTPQGFHLASDATGLTLHIPPLPNLAEIVLILAAIGFALFLLLLRRNLKWLTIRKPWKALTGLLQRNYVTTLILFGIAAIIWAVYHYLWQIPELIGQMLTKLKGEIDGADTYAIRNIGYTFAALAGMLAILATIPFQLVRVWINERTATTQEANLTTGLINTAVEGLGAEKKVSRIGRPVTFTREGEPDHTAIEWQDGEPPSPPDETWKPEKRGDWQTFDQTVPNIEVRVGAILTLDRIAREDPGEHIRVMDILCAYIRENAPAKDAKDHDLGPWPDYPKNPTIEQIEERRKLLEDRSKKLRAWIEDLPKPRTDIQTALTTIGNRDPERIAREEAQYIRGGETGYRLDLRETNLRKCDLSHFNLNDARLDHARMEGADLSRARMKGAGLRETRMEGTNLSGIGMDRADLRKAHMERVFFRFGEKEEPTRVAASFQEARLLNAQMQGVDFSGVRMEGASFWRARMEQVVLRGAGLGGADLRQVRMEGSDLSGADLGSAKWAGARVASLAYKTDFRGAQGLTQAQLDQMIGNEMTLLPEGPAPDTNQPYSIPSCWMEPPTPFVAAMERRGYNWKKDPDGYRCLPGQEPARTGQPYPFDAPYPPGHPRTWRDRAR